MSLIEDYLEFVTIIKAFYELRSCVSEQVVRAAWRNSFKSWRLNRESWCSTDMEFKSKLQEETIEKEQFSCFISLYLLELWVFNIILQSWEKSVFWTSFCNNVVFKVSNILIHLNNRDWFDSRPILWSERTGQRNFWVRRRFLWGDIFNIQMWSIVFWT